MKSRRFNGFIPRVNENWVAKVLGMELNGKGPDLFNDNCEVEVKFSLKDGKGKYHLCWTVLEYQMVYPQEHPGKNIYWALGLYKLNRTVSSIGRNEVPNLENFVMNRELWMIPWEWMNQFSPSRTSGKSKHSEWDIELRYPKVKDLPLVVKTYKVPKGIIHLTEGINPEDFPNLN
ncbi:MAG: hypothetical protein AABY15_08310 [Nanoarchaeota archaeon]